RRCRRATGEEMRLVIAAALALVGCSTPYQQMGFRGGYRDRPMGGGRYLVEVRVNGYTSSGTALEYLHRRATELCGGANYVVEDGTADASYGVVRTGNSAHVYSKPELSALVRCQPPPVPVAAQTPPAPSRKWWHCTTVGPFTPCFESAEQCEFRRAQHP